MQFNLIDLWIITSKSFKHFREIIITCLASRWLCVAMIATVLLSVILNVHLTLQNILITVDVKEQLSHPRITLSVSCFPIILYVLFINVSIQLCKIDRWILINIYLAWDNELLYINNATEFWYTFCQKMCNKAAIYFRILHRLIPDKIDQDDYVQFIMACR